MIKMALQIELLMNSQCCFAGYISPIYDSRHERTTNDFSGGRQIIEKTSSCRVSRKMILYQLKNSFFVSELYKVCHEIGLFTCSCH